MAKKAGFYGAPCYDLINYVARILTQLGKSVLMLDVSADQSLSCSVPLPDAYDGSEFDYRDVTFSLIEPEYMGMDYEVVLYYFGADPEIVRPVDYAFCITSAEQHVIADVNAVRDRIVYDDSASDDVNGVRGMVCFPRNKTNMVALGPGVDLRARYIAQLLDIPKRELILVDMDEGAILCRLSCQYDAAFRFRRLSPDYKELLYRVCSTLCGEELDTKRYRKAYRLAERGR